MPWEHRAAMCYVQKVKRESWWVLEKPDKSIDKHGTSLLAWSAEGWELAGIQNAESYSAGVNAGTWYNPHSLYIWKRPR